MNPLHRFLLLLLALFGVPASLFAQTLAGTPTTLKVGATNVTVSLVRKGADGWTAGSPGSPTFTLMGGTGASIVSQTITDTEHATVVLDAGSQAGMIGVQDPTGGTDSTGSAETAILYVEPPLYLTYSYANPQTGATEYSPANFIPNGVPLTVTANGLGTSWTSGTSFTLSGCATASLTSTTVVSATMANLAINPGNTDCTITVTDSSTGNTAALPVHTPHTFYVRGDGGGRYDANRVSFGYTGKDIGCNGTTNASYASALAYAQATDQATTNMPCGYSDFRYIYDDEATYAAYSLAISGGDTVILETPYPTGQPGEPTGQTGWRVGWDSVSGSQMWCWGQNGAFSCGNAPFPSGIPAQHTRLLGQNYGACSTGTSTSGVYAGLDGVTNRAQLTELFGGQSVYNVLSLDGTAWMDVQCLHITRHSGCSRFGTNADGSADTTIPACNRSTPPYDDSADNGVWTGNGTSNITFKDVWVDGISFRGFKGPIGLGTFTLDRVDVSYNAFTGVDFDRGDGRLLDNIVPNVNTLGQYQSPAWRSLFSTIEWSGCYEMYPVPSGRTVLAVRCYGQSNQGQGDGLGSANTGQEMDAYFDHSLLRYNTQDGEDFGHVFGSDPHIFHAINSAAYGSAGSQWKWGGGFSDILFENNLADGNCYRMQQPIADSVANYGLNMTDNCRPAGSSTMSLNFHNNATALFAHNTIIGYSSVVLDPQCTPQGDDPANCPNTTWTIENNVILSYASGYMNYNGDGAAATYCIAGCNSNGNNNNIGNVILKNNSYYGVRDCNPNPTSMSGVTNVTASGETCNDPRLINEPTQAAVTAAESALDNLNYGLSSSSPNIGMGVAVSGLTTDYAGNVYATPPSIGALESGSNAAPPVGVSSFGSFVASLMRVIHSVLSR